MTSDIRLRWQTDESLPLQVVEREQTRYANMRLYQGFPVAFGIQIPGSLKPNLAVKAAEEDPSVPGNAFPGGAVFDEIQIVLDATKHDWIWLKAESKN